MLDLRDTFEFTPIFEVGTPEFERADRTIDVLKLNERDFLPEARKNAYQSYLDSLCEYGRQTDPDAKQRRLDAIHGGSHPTVWWEMKRQGKCLEQLAKLFARAPELLDS